MGLGFSSVDCAYGVLETWGLSPVNGRGDNNGNTIGLVKVRRLIKYRTVFY